MHIHVFVLCSVAASFVFDVLLSTVTVGIFCIIVLPIVILKSDQVNIPLCA